VQGVRSGICKKTAIQDLFVNLAKADKSAKEIKVIINKAFGDKALSTSQVFKLVAVVKADKDTKDKRVKTTLRLSGLLKLLRL